MYLLRERANVPTSIHLRVQLYIEALNDLPPRPQVFKDSDVIRRHTGYVYHHRFNALTWSTYARCLEELDMFMGEQAEFWFTEWREPHRLVTHPGVEPSARERIDEAVAGTAMTTNTLRELGLVGSKLTRAKAITVGL